MKEVYSFTREEQDTYISSENGEILFGENGVSGIAAQALVHLREMLGLEGPTHIQDPLLFLGRVEEDVRKALDVDFVGISAPGTKYGFMPEGEKPFTLADGSTALIAGNFHYTTDDQGRRWAYPQNDTSCAPSAMMPKGGHYFDPLTRQQPYDEDDLDGISGFPRSIEGVKIAALLREIPGGAVKASLRAVPGYDAAAICAQFGGGGHKGAAGCTLKMSLKDAAEAIKAAMPEMK